VTAGRQSSILPQPCEPASCSTGIPWTKSPAAVPAFRESVPKGSGPAVDSFSVVSDLHPVKTGRLREPACFQRSTATKDYHGPAAADHRFHSTMPYIHTVVLLPTRVLGNRCATLEHRVSRNLGFTIFPRKTHLAHGGRFARRFDLSGFHGNDRV
jgi:hypothetical protein